MESLPGNFVQGHPFFLLLCQLTSGVFVQRVGNLGKILDEASIMTYQANKALDTGICLQFGYPTMARRLSRLGHTLFVETQCPRYSIFFWKNSHLEGLSLRSCRQKHSSMAHSHLICSSCAGISYIVKIDETSRIIQVSQTVISLWKVTGVLQSQNGICSH